MSELEKCPSRQWLEKLVDGDVTKEQESKLSDHLDRCKTCRAILDQLSEYDALKATNKREKDLVSDADVDDSDLIQSALSKIRSSPPNGISIKSGYADIVPWLESSDEHIGTIAEFDLVRFIGRGGMGLVFESFDNKLQRKVAIKLMSPSLLADSNASERFLREARAAAKINHVNVVTVHAVDQIRGLPYLVMELVSGESIEELLEKNGDLSVADILKIARQTAIGLDAAHKQGITHRDIKPSNLMIDRESKKIKIADFGLASTLNDTSFTRSGMLVGTPDFASPEQVNSKPVDARSDLFSLGSVLYLICTRELPFSQDSLVATLDSVRNMELPPVNLSHNRIPTALATVIRRLMKKDPCDRYQSARELLSAIDDVLISLRSPSSSTSTESSEFPWRWVAIIALTAAVPLILALATVLRLSWNGSESDVVNRAHHDLNQSYDDETDDRAELNDRRIVEVENDAQLRTALESDANLTIKLSPGQTYRLEQSLQTEGRVIVIEGAPEDHPQIEFSSIEELPAVSFERCDVTFRSIDLYCSIENDSSVAILTCIGGALRLEEVFFVSAREGNTIELEESELTVKSSALASRETIFSASTMNGQVALIEDSVIAAKSTFEIGGSTRFEFMAHGSQFLNHQMFLLFEEKLDEFHVRFNATDCAFKSGKSLLAFEMDSALLRDAVLKEIPDRLKWEIVACELPEMPVFTEVDNIEELMSWEDVHLELDPESKIVESDEGSADMLLEQLIEREFETITDVMDALP